MSNKISVIILSYNRSDLLEGTFFSIKSALKKIGVHAEYILSDDASDEIHHENIYKLPFDKILLSKKNQGLGANVNKALAVAKYDYIMQIQDDCKFVGDPIQLMNALCILTSDDRVGIVQLVSSREAQVMENCYLAHGVQYSIFINDNLNHIRPCGLRPYSDQPHLKRREFCLDIGSYLEGTPMTIMELEYQRRIANQGKWYVAALFGDKLFQHLGADRTFNPSIIRARRIAKLNSIFMFKIVYNCLRYLKNFIMKLKSP